MPDRLAPETQDCRRLQAEARGFGKSLPHRSRHRPRGPPGAEGELRGFCHRDKPVEDSKETQIDGDVTASQETGQAGVTTSCMEPIARIADTERLWSSFGASGGAQSRLKARGIHKHIEVRAARTPQRTEYTFVF